MGAWGYGNLENDTVLQRIYASGFALGLQEEVSKEVDSAHNPARLSPSDPAQ